MKRYLQHILQSTEKAAEDFMKFQVKESHRPDFGGLEGKLIDVKPTVYQVQHVITVYLYDKSKYYKNESFLLPIKRALDFVERELRPEGTLDFPSCNFSSAPDTAFCLKQLVPAYQLLEKFTEKEELSDIKEQLLRIIKRATIGIKNGGFHTPNHRWAITASLMQGYSLFKDDPLHESFLERAKQYLAEGIDGNEDGEYAERSTGNYNAVVNTSLITMYEETGDEEYLYYVKRNLEMMLNYFEPDNTIFTQNSTRQDKGKREYGNKYFYQFLYIAEHFNDEILAKAAHQLIYDNEYRHDEGPLCLYKLLLNERLLDVEFTSKSLLTSYRKYFKESGVVRFREGDFSYSILENKKKFLFIQKKELQIFVRIGISYCDIRSFVPQKIERTEDGYELSFTGKGWYYLPFEEDQGTKDWWQMDHSKRNLLIANSIDIKVKIHEMEKGLDIELLSEGRDKIPVRLEIAIPEKGDIETNDVVFTGQAGQQMILKQKAMRASYEHQCIEIGPGFGEHKFTGHYSGEEQNLDQYTVIMTDYTPISRRVEVRFTEK